MKSRCPNLNCCSAPPDPLFPIGSGLKGRRIVRAGSYYRKSDSRRVRRFHCRNCGKHFSRATLGACYRQKRRRLNEPLRDLLCSGVSLRRSAKILGANRKTVVRKFRFLATRARLEHALFLEGFRADPIAMVQFDDLETSEHSKCKPLSVALAVEPKMRKILNFQVAQMPAKGLLAKIARKKYGPRSDQRGKAWNRMMQELKPYVRCDAHWLSDQNPHYPRFLRRHHPIAKHETVKGRRGCVAGQGELKKIGFDPLFSLNHTCAMLRANMNRLFRRTWCTTKTRSGLSDHLAIYVSYHNRCLTRASSS